MIHKFKDLYRLTGPEPAIWILAFASLAMIDPAVTATFSICPLHALGFQHCPGCGLGRSISYLLHGNITDSLECHILGIPATIILILRVLAVLKNGWQGRLIFHQVH